MYACAEIPHNFAKFPPARFRALPKFFGLCIAPQLLKYGPKKRTQEADPRLLIAPCGSAVHLARDDTELHKL